MNQEETMLLHKERYKETIKNLTVMSDILARNVFKDKNACEYVLRIILEDKELTVIDNETQMDFRNMHGRGVVLDCVAKDGSGRVFNVEIQQDDEGAHPKRARYHLGMMDSNVLDTGKNFDKLPETYVIFVTLKDAFGCGLPIAHIDRIIRENGKEFGDEEHFIYVDLQQGRWRRAWKTDARLPGEGSEGDAGGSLGRPRARTERDRERGGTYVQGNGSPASGRRRGRKNGSEKSGSIFSR